MFCDLITMPRYRGNFCYRQIQYCEFSLDYERDKLVKCLVIKYNAYGINLLQKKRFVPPPPFFPMGVYKRLVFCQKLPQKSQILTSKVGGWAFIRAWALIRDFTVYKNELHRMKTCLWDF